MTHPIRSLRFITHIRLRVANLQRQATAWHAEAVPHLAGNFAKRWENGGMEGGAGDLEKPTVEFQIHRAGNIPFQGPRPQTAGVAECSSDTLKTHVEMQGSAKSSTAGTTLQDFFQALTVRFSLPKRASALPRCPVGKGGTERMLV